MRHFFFLLVLLWTASSVFASKKIASPETSAGNELVDIVATITLAEDEVAQKLGVDPGKGIVLLQVKITPKTDKSVQVGPDDFILLAHNDGERNKPFEPEQLASDGALIIKNTATSSPKKSTPSFSAGGLYGGGGGASPGNSKPVVLGATMDSKAQGNKALLEALKKNELPTKDASESVQGYLYFALDGKHKLKDLAVLYRGPAGRLDLEFEH